MNFILHLLTPLIAHAADYTPLAPAIPGVSTANVTTAANLGTYLESLFEVGVSVAGALAVIMIIIGGIQYMSTDAIGGKEEGKEKITQAIWGLLLALVAFLILNTINPQLVSNNLGTTLTTASGGSVSNAVGDNTATAGSNPSGYVSTGSTGSSGSSGGGSNASIVNYALSGKGFPSTSGLTNDQALNLVNQSGIMNVPLSDADKAKYFPNGVTAQGYVNLLAGIANSESGFNPNDNINHSKGTDVGNTYSEGLFSLSTGDSAVKKLGYGSDAALANPSNNTEAALSILKNQVQKTGSLVGSKDNHYWGPWYRQQ